MKLIPKMEGIDAEDAADHVADPTDIEVSFPFGPAKICNNASPSGYKKGTNPRKIYLKALLYNSNILIV